MTSVLDSIVSRIRKGNTVFKDRVSKILTMQVGDAYTKIAKPNLLIAPVFENVVFAKKGTGASDHHDEIVRMRGYVLVGYFDVSPDLRSEEDGLSEQATEDLIRLLVNWRIPGPPGVFGPGMYESMRIIAGSKTEAVFSWTFHFPMNMSVDCLDEFDPTDSVATISSSIPEMAVSFKRKL